MHEKRFLAAAFCIILLFSLCACKRSEAGKTENGVYTDAYQSLAEENYDELTVKIRTSSSAYFPGSVIAITAVIENESDKYYAVVPFGIDVTADGYKLELLEKAFEDELLITTASQTDAVSVTDTADKMSEKELLILEPHGSVSMTKEYLTNAEVNGQLVPLWECKVTAELSIEVGNGCESRELAIKAEKFEKKTTKTVVDVYGTGDKPA